MSTLTQPAVARDRRELDVRLRGCTTPVVLVPTMGALHEGHAALMRLARERAGETGTVVVSIFVNPLQFGPDEDLDRYPRTYEADLELAAREGVDVVFAPEVAEMYPDGVPLQGTSAPAITVDPGPIADRLEGATRPGHFRGVLTVCAKLFGLVRPEAAIFGEKDFQQLSLIRRMVTDLCLDIDIVGAPTEREPDGLARSSRNQYLSAQQRQQAVALNRALRAAQERTPYGAPAARWAAMSVLQTAPGVELDYLALTTAGLDELPDHPAAGAEGRILVAARVGTTRLIDNMALSFDHPDHPGHPVQGPTVVTAGTATTEGVS